MKAKIIKNYPNYSITEEGKVYSSARKRLIELKPQVSTKTKKYLQVRLFNGTNPKGKLFYIHRLVFESYYGEINENMTIDHIDSNTKNNHYTNLQELSLSENAKKGRVNRKKYESTKSKIWELKDELIKLYNNGVSQPKISKKYNCSETTVYRIINNISRK